MIKLFALFSFLLPALAFAGVEQITETEFRALANELAQKVNIFQEVWKQDPEAAFYGGTTRDYLYWLKGKFRDASKREEALQIVKDLQALPTIQVREFIIGDSDVDVVSGKPIGLNSADYGVRKFDTIPRDIFDPATVLGQNEIGQGYAPAEKIRISGTSGISQAEELGDGVHEIYSGKLSVHFPKPEKFLETKYAQEGLNHPILLALRYLRLQAINYYQTFGKGFPDLRNLQKGLDSESAEAVRQVILSTLDGKELLPYLKRPKFKSWLNGTIQKAFRSYTNPTAALEYMKMFGVDHLAELYPNNQIEPVNEYVFSQFRDRESIENSLQHYQVKKSFFQKPENYFPDGFLYHGTPDEAAFRSILFQGVLPSTGGSAGAGLYGVAEKDKKFAETYKNSKPDNLLKFPVKDDAKIVDLTAGEGNRVWKDFKKSHGDNFELFAETFGIDILKYPYTPEAYVVKNSDALEKAQGVNRQLLPFSELFSKVPSLTDAREFFETMKVNQLTPLEVQLLLQQSSLPAQELDSELQRSLKQDASRTYKLFQKTVLWNKNAERNLLQVLKFGDWSEIRPVLEELKDLEKINSAVFIEALSKMQGRERIVQIISLLGRFQDKINFHDLLLMMASSENYENLASSYIYLFHAVPKSEDRKTLLSHFIHSGKFSSDFLVRQFFKTENDEYAPLFLELIKTYQGKRNESFSTTFLNTILQRWTNHPELLEALLPKYGRTIALSIAWNPLWSKAMQAKLWQEYIFETTIPGFAGNDWDRDVSVLRQISKQMKNLAEERPEFTSTNAKFQREIRLALLKDDLWQQAPDVFKETTAFSTTPAADLLQVSNLKNISDYLEILREEIAYFPKTLNKQSGELTEKLKLGLNLVKVFSQPRWAEHPEIFQQLLNVDKNLITPAQSQYRDNLVEILQSPTWADHPEILEKFAVLPNEIATDHFRRMSDLLNHPNWIEHPTFRWLEFKLPGYPEQLSADKFMRYAAYKQKKGILPKTKLGFTCGEYFSILVSF